MKDTFTDANFPTTADGRVYHLGIRPGEIANRILTVGSPSRAEAIASLLDNDSNNNNNNNNDNDNNNGDGDGDGNRTRTRNRHEFRLASERGFLTITGRFNGTPVSIVSIGMGYPNMDFFVREARECVSGDMVIVRLGSCGGLTILPVGSLVVPSSCVAVRRNYDYDFPSDVAQAERSDGPPYLVSKPVDADRELHDFLIQRLKRAPPLDPPVAIAASTVNASADSFYASQGRQTSFPDHNETLIDDLIERVPGLASLEMETFHLLHLAHVWKPRPHPETKSKPGGLTVPPTNVPVSPALTPPPPPFASVLPSSLAPPSGPASASSSDSQPTAQSSLDSGSERGQTPRIRAAAVQMIFANRRSQEFITPARVGALEAWSGGVVLEALRAFSLPIAGEGEGRDV